MLISFPGLRLVFDSSKRESAVKPPSVRVSLAPILPPPYHFGQCGLVFVPMTNSRDSRVIRGFSTIALGKSQDARKRQQKIRVGVLGTTSRGDRSLAALGMTDAALGMTGVVSGSWRAGGDASVTTNSTRSRPGGRSYEECAFFIFVGTPSLARFRLVSPSREDIRGREAAPTKYVPRVMDERSAQSVRRHVGGRIGAARPR